MPRPAINLHQKVRQILGHTAPLPPEAACPIQHFDDSIDVGLALIKYIQKRIPPGSFYPAPFERHLGHLRRMVLVEMIEAFERFIKELAAVSVDALAPFMADDRFDEFVPRRGGQVSAFVNAGSIGKALCESDTWLNNDTINRRFRSLLKDHFAADWECVFPGPSQTPAGERVRAATMAILWQLRHNAVHNIGVLTHSDSMRFRVLTGGPVPVERSLTFANEDLRYVKRFLAETALSVNRRVGARAALLLERLHVADSGLFDAPEMANRLSRWFDYPVTVHGQIGSV